MSSYRLNSVWSQLASEFIDHARDSCPTDIKRICCDGLIDLPGGKYLPRSVGQ